MLFMPRLRQSRDLDAIEAPPPLRRAARPKVGLALGGGAAKGWAHIGVVKALTENGLIPDIVAGTSIGAVAGGCWAAGKIAALENFATGLTKRNVFSFMDFTLARRGLISGDKLRRQLNAHLDGCLIEDLPVPFAAVATEIETGHEVWTRKGSLVEAMRASYALPGIFEPVGIGGRWLMDGAFVNPIPVTTARALGADVVIAVNLNSDVFMRSSVIHSHGPRSGAPDAAGLAKQPGLFAPVLGMASLFRRSAERGEAGPGIATVMVDAFNIVQDRIARSRLAGDPPDMMINPKLGGLGLMEFHKARDSIAIGEEATLRVLPEIKSCFAAALAPMH